MESREGNTSSIQPGPEGPANASEQRREIAEAMARLNQPTQMSESQRSRACIDDIKEWLTTMNIDSSNLEELLVEDMMQERQQMADNSRPNDEQEPSKTSMLIDLMVKNQLQNKCGQEMTQVMEVHSLQNKEAVEHSFPLELLSKHTLSTAAQRDFDRLMKVFASTGTGPKPDFVNEISRYVENQSIETIYYKTKAKAVNFKIEQVSKPRWEAKLCLRDTLQRIYDVEVRTQAKELSLQSLKIQQETRQKLSNLRDAQAEANAATAQTADTKEEVEQLVTEISTLAGQHQQQEDQVACLFQVMESEYAGLDPDVQKARIEVALLRDQLIAKEEEAKQAAAAKQ